MYAKKIFFLLIFLLGFSPHFQAQTKKKSGETDTIKVQLTPVTVTATRYPENILEIPYAVSILTKEQLMNTMGYGLDEVLQTVPGVLAQSRNGNQDIRIVIRGFGARGAGDRSNSGTSRGIRIMMDGIPETEPDGRTSFDNIDISMANHIEVIRSNSSALWGNAGGGIINISSVPDFTDPFLSLSGSAGSFGLQKYTLQSGTVLGSGQLSLSYSNTSFSGWRDHSSSYRSLLNIGLVSNLDDRTKLGAYVVGVSNLFHIPGPLTQQQFDSDPRQANTTYSSRDERRFNRLGRIGLTLSHKLNNSHEFSGMVYINPKYLQRSERGTFRDFTRYHFGGNLIYHNYSEFKGEIKNILTIGVDEAYQDGAVLFYSLSPTNGRGDVLKDNKREGANNFGAFVQTEVTFGEKVSLIAGGRYDNVTYYSENFLDPELGLQQKSFERFTPKAGITYRFSPTHSIYANLGGGVEVPAGNETNPAGTYGQDSVYLLNPLLEPITSTTLEAGTKHMMYIGRNTFLHSLSYDVALYYITIKNDIIPYRGGRFYFTAGRTDRAGVELGVNLQMAHGISFQGSFTYSQNVYKEYLVDSVHYGLPGKFADYEDNKVAGIPDFFYYGNITYSPKILKGLYIGLSVNGMDKYFADDANSINVPSYNIFSASLGMKNEIRISDFLSVRGFISVNNLTDEKYAASAFINPDVVDGKPVFLEPGLPRNFTASLSIGFN